VDWSDAADMVRFRKVIPQELPRSLQFEYRDVATDADRLDLWIHLARRAFDEGRIDEAAAHVERVLRVEPLATSGLILRGQTKLAKGDCRAATQDWMLAANVLENNADVLNKWQASRRRMIDGNPEHAAANLRARVNRLSCK
jgi:Tfp pilus assembly protein PilF